MTDKNESKSRGTKLTLGLTSIKSKLGLSDSGSGNKVIVQQKRKKITLPNDNTPNKNQETRSAVINDASGLTNAEKDRRFEVLKKAKEEQAITASQIALQKEMQLKEKIIIEEAEVIPETPLISETKKPNVKITLKKEESKKEEISISSNINNKEADSAKTYKADSLLPKKAPEDADFVKDKEVPKKVKAIYETRRANSKIVLSKLEEEDSADEFSGTRRRRSLASIKRAREKAKRHELNHQPQEKFAREVIIPEFLTVQELSNRMAERGNDVIKALIKMGMIVTINQTIDADTAELVVTEMGHIPKRVNESDIENLLIHEQDREDELVSRAPVVTIMGHVDHGKTSLLDALRSTDVVSGEAGGITQHIGAYRVTLSDNRSITFLDTPGHEAFTAMRMRGANATDIVVLVVAADDGIMDQTVEAINHAKAAKVPIIVAINKIDKPEADAARVKSELLSHELVCEDMGGDIITIEVSAKQKIGLANLEEAILLQAEMLELKANPNRKAMGVVIESVLDKGKGPIATLLVKNGTLNIGDLLVCGSAYGKVRGISDDKGNKLMKAGPSIPVEIIGLDEVPEAGELFSIANSEKNAKHVTEYRKKKSFEKKIASSSKQNLENLFSKAANGLKELPIIIKADTKGSVEAIAGSLEKLNDNEVSVKILHGAVGGISESDVNLAKASNAIIIGFNVRATQDVKTEIEKSNIKLQYYSIIYNIIDDIKALMNGLLEPIIREKYLGTAEVRNVFSVKGTKVAGCFVIDGTLKRNSNLRILRDNVVIHTGKLKTLRRFKDDVKEVATNYECGIAIENYQDIKEKDKIEVFDLVEEQRT